MRKKIHLIRQLSNMNFRILSNVNFVDIFVGLNCYRMIMILTSVVKLNSSRRSIVFQRDSFSDVYGRGMRVGRFCAYKNERLIIFVCVRTRVSHSYG